MTLLSILLFAIFIYARIIKKKDFFSMIGIGDLLLFLVFVFGYEPSEFVVHFTFAMIFSLVVHLIMKSQYKRHLTVPLAGYMAVFFSVDKLLSFLEII
ncbi:hypothetical protein [Nonlabens ulvanivorans]|uniref:hypothetical protein n=1 Tax=Nonlabens ulvanivorans TaxID=906888 RepID=UPI0037CC038B